MSFPDGPTPAVNSRVYRVTHRTEYSYSDVVTSSYGRGHLTPRDTTRQRCLTNALEIDPAPPTGPPAATLTATSARTSTSASVITR